MCIARCIGFPHANPLSSDHTCALRLLTELVAVEESETDKFSWWQDLPVEKTMLSDVLCGRAGNDIQEVLRPASFCI